MSKRSIYISARQFVALIVLIILSIMCFFLNRTEGYMIGLLPVTFIACYVFLLGSLCKKSMTVTIVTVCAALRYVLLPLMHSISPVFSFSRITINDIGILNKAIGLMCYELFFVSVFLWIYINRKRKRLLIDDSIDEKIDDKFDLEHNRYGIVLLFSFIAIASVMFYPQVLSQISFMSIRVNTAQRIGLLAAESSSFDSIMKQVFVTAILALYVVGVSSIKRNIYPRNPKSAFGISLFLTLMIIGLIVSEQRSAQVYSAFAGIVLMTQLYPEKKRTITGIIGVFAGVVLAILSVYKVFYAFMYESYADAIANSNYAIGSFTKDLEIYLLGPVTVASSLLFAEVKTIAFTFTQLLYDFGRSTIGLSFLLKSAGMTLTSEAYNLYVTNGIAKSGLLLPITGQGYAFFGVILSPVLICLFYAIAIRMENYIKTSRSTYAVFFISYAYIRLATCMVSANLNSVIVASSTVAVSAGTIILCQKLFDSLVRGAK